MLLGGLRLLQSALGAKQLPGLVGEAGSNLSVSKLCFLYFRDKCFKVTNRSGEGSANLRLLSKSSEVSTKVFPEDVSSDTSSHETDCPQ